MEEQKPKKEDDSPKTEQASLEAEDSDSLDSPSTVDQNKPPENSKEQPETPAEAGSGDGTVTDTTHGAKIEKKRPALSGVNKLKAVNIYLLLFILMVVLAGVFTYLGYLRNKSEEEKKEAVLTEPLSNEALEQLKQTDVKVGDPKQILTIESNAIFSGNVLIRDSLEVAGQLKIGKPLELSGVTVSGSSNFDQLKSNGLDVSGNAAIQGQLSIQQGLTVGGNLTVGGSLSAAKMTINNLEVNGDLNVNRHINAGGGTPGRSRGSALGSGGTVSISGNDTAGTVNINAGSGAGGGCLATVTFASAYSSTPHIAVTPTSSAAAGLNFYVSRNSSSFSICTPSSSGVGGKSFAFDYIVIN